MTRRLAPTFHSPVRFGLATLVAIAFLAACSRKSAPPSGLVEPSAPVETAASVGRNDTMAPSASSTPDGSPPSGTVRLETLVTPDPDDDAAPRAYETWLVDGATRHLLARELGILPEGNPNESPVTASLDGGRVRYEVDGQNVPSTWVGTMSAEFSVRPLAVTRQTTHYFNRMWGCASEDSTWSDASFSGDVHGQCRRGEACDEFAYLPLPDVELPDDYVRGTWSCKRIDGCSVAVDGTKGRGFVTFGQRRGDDPTIRAVVSGRSLLVTIEGATPEPRGDENWVGDDHLEIWVASEAPSYAGCAEPPVARQWGVRVSDGRVFAGAGAGPALLRVERAACDQGTTALRIELPEKHGGLTLAYSAALDREQRMMFATSRLAFNRSTSLGSTRKLDPKRVTCGDVGGRLAPIHHRLPDGEPLLRFE